MNKSDVRIGMKVVPHAKSVDYMGDPDSLENSVVWQRARLIAGQPYLFVASEEMTYDGKMVWCLTERADYSNGDYFNAEDFSLYEEPSG